MKRKALLILWACIAFMTISIQSFHLFNFFTQPTLNDYYNGKTVVYAALVFGSIGVVFIAALVYTFVIFLRERQLSLWFYNVLACFVFLFFSEVFFGMVAERFFPLNLWSESTLKKIQQGLKR